MKLCDAIEANDLETVGRLVENGAQERNAVLAGGADPHQTARDGDTAYFLAKNGEVRALLPSEP